MRLRCQVMDQGESPADTVYRIKENGARKYEIYREVRTTKERRVVSGQFTYYESAVNALMRMAAREAHKTVRAVDMELWWN